MSKLAKRGQEVKAIPLLEQTLADRERLLGDDHPDTRTSRNNLALAYLAEDQRADAIPLLEQTLTDFKRLLGADHPSTKALRENLAALTGKPTPGDGK